MARTFAECQEMIRVSEETGMPLFVAYYRRTLPSFLKVKELIEEGAIGKVLTVNLRLHRAFGEKISVRINNHGVLIRKLPVRILL